MSQTLHQGIVNEDPFHPAIVFDISPNEIKFMKNKRATKFNYFKADYNSMNGILNLKNWINEFNNLHTNEAIAKFYEIIYPIINKYTPKITLKSDNLPKWYSKRLIELIHEKEHYFNFKNVFTEKKRSKGWNEKKSEKLPK